MRVLISAGIFPPDVGGPASYVPAIASALGERGHRVDIVCLADGVNVNSAYPFSVTRIARGGSKLLRLTTVVRALARHGASADVIYANGLSLEAQCAGELRSTPVVHKVVGDWAWERARNRGWYQGTVDEYQIARKGMRLRLLDRLRTAPLRRAAGVIAPSKYLSRMVTSWGIEPPLVTVVYNALPPSPPMASNVPLPRFSGRTLMTVCRLVPWKGVEGLLRLIREHADWRLVVIGSGPLRAALERHAVALGVGDRVCWMGQRAPAEVQALLSAADVFVLNSSYEGLPHVVLEAMRARVPVVATAAGGTPEVVNHGRTGLLVPPGDFDALDAAVAAIVSSPSTSQRLVANALAWTQEQFGFETMVSETERALEAAVRRRSVAPTQ